MRGVISSDWHPDWVTHGIRRYAEVEAAVNQSVDAAIAEKSDFYVFAGDLCDPDSGASVFKCVELVISAAVRLERHKIHSCWVAGNHDVIEDGSGKTTLSPLVPLERTGFVHVFEHPRVEVIGDMTFIALPFTATSHAYEPSLFLKKVRQKPLHGRPLVVGHLHVPGVQPGEETTEMPRGREITFPIAETRDLLCINGHYHRHQVTDDGIIIPGSLARLTFCEEGNKPRFLVLDI